MWRNEFLRGAVTTKDLSIKLRRFNHNFIYEARDY